MLDFIIGAEAMSYWFDEDEVNTNKLEGYEDLIIASIETNNIGEELH
jgi:hypothetical protein